jgi:hypothetical protein
LARSIIEKDVGEVWIEFSDKQLAFGLKEGIKEFRFLRLRPHGLSMALSYGHLKK